MRFGFFVLLSIAFAGCTIRDKPPESKTVVVNAYEVFYNQVKEGKLLLKNGDLVVRSGNDITSQLIKSFNRKDKNYSHAGLVFFKNGEPMIFHILAGDENPGGKMTIDSLEKFSHPRHNSAFAIYRYDMDPTEIFKLKEAVTTWYAQSVRFDSTFNLRNDDRMYCSEMIKKGLARATGNRIMIETVKPTKPEAQLASTRLSLSPGDLMKLDLVPIDHLYMNPHCRLIGRFDFNPKK